MPKKKSSRKKQSKKTQTRRPRAKASARPRAAAPARKSKERLARTKSRSKTRRKRGDVTGVRSIASVQGNVRGKVVGQSGDNERLSRVARADSQSVEELADEGQAFESEVVSGV